MRLRMTSASRSPMTMIAAGMMCSRSVSEAWPTSYPAGGAVGGPGGWRDTVPGWRRGGYRAGGAERGMQRCQLAWGDGDPVDIEGAGQAVELWQRGEPLLRGGDRRRVAPD